ncbi:hypothetical protein PXK00_06395 [Phaeobacter sp. QD34_3]|uniref:hypothetical protein n=1 Tax=unclassified Phaeobacter TaxID=2621772 RepID=UPI00237F1C2E|nr:MULTISPECIES: hypothetical protein [unclassified Phaeobacter]MDE4132730.1 hypothetical protein [Phaeobacter sp. QD34_3]MDE4136477.1 hypothetical protein [Phaeobacter sp. QD34_24]MDE4173333.1 hypothetical protein [Phaeobacter sp. PT47_59]
MLTLDKPHTLWKNGLKVHRPIRVDPDLRDHTVYHLTALSKKETPLTPTKPIEGSDRGMAYREQRRIGLQGDRLPGTQSHLQQVMQMGLAPKWQNPPVSAGQSGTAAAAAQSQISSAAKALWQQYMALMSGRAVGPLPMSVIEACASYAASKQVVAA